MPARTMMRRFAEIAGSIRAFGFTNPLLVSPRGDVIAGHGRLAAARRLARRMCR
jgi:ParB-like chromosome segregation protein Spo0J